MLGAHLSYTIGNLLTLVRSQLSYAPIESDVILLGTHLSYTIRNLLTLVRSQLSHAPISVPEYYNTFLVFVKTPLRKNLRRVIIALGAVLVGEPAVPCTRNPL